MKIPVFPLLSLFSLLLLTACGNKNEFRVSVDSDAIGTQQLTVVYTLPSGNRAVVKPTAVDGHAEFRGNAPEPSVIEVFGSSGAPLFSLMALNGEKINVEIADGVTRITGAANSLPPAAEAEPDTLTFVAPRVIVARDSSEVWDAEGIWVFTSTARERTPAIMDTIKANRKRVRDVFISTEFDVWREAVRRDSATWSQGLLPEGPVSLPALTSTPLLLEISPTGQILRHHQFQQ